MRTARLARALALAAVAASATTAFAQPPHGHHPAPPQPPPAPPPPPGVRPGSPAAVAYLSGKQALVGWHAPSTKPVARDASGRAMLTLRSINRGDALSVPALGDDGGFAATDLDRMAHLLRASSGEEHPLDPRTLSLVYRIQAHFGAAEVVFVSGYRVPKPGSRSNHGKGRAVDLIVPGVADEEVARFARDQGFVGVGVYPTSQFVHVDVRPRSYFWVDYSGPHTKNRESSIFGDLAAKGDAAALARGQAPIEPFDVATDVDAALRARGMPVEATTTDDEEDDEN
jgi:uncharacterized protein YcbK (DUF882 family)